MGQMESSHSIGLMCDFFFSFFNIILFCKLFSATVRKAKPAATDFEIAGPIKRWLAKIKERMDRRIASNGSTTATMD